MSDRPGIIVFSWFSCLLTLLITEQLVVFLRSKLCEALRRLVLSKWRNAFQVGKCHVPDHDTTSKEGKEKKVKLFDGKTTSNADDNDKDELAYCDRCTEQVEQLIQCKRFEMWLCSNCEKVPDEVITLIGKFCEFRVHWYCKICDKPAVKAMHSYSHMSNPFREDIMNSINTIVIESFNKVIRGVHTRRGSTKRSTEG